MVSSRRSFLKKGLILPWCVPFLGARISLWPTPPDDRFGPLQEDARGVLDLPSGFSYRIIGRAGQRMSDALHAPMFPAAIGVLEESDSHLLLACNHRVEPDTPSRTGPFGFKDVYLTPDIRSRLYDVSPSGKPARGSVTLMRVDARHGVSVGHHLALSGLLSCGHGTLTPWGSWLCAEQSAQVTTDRYARDHGFVFEVRPGPEGLQHAVPLTAMGRAGRGGIAVDPDTGTVYFSLYDEHGGVYRFRPEHEGDLSKGRVDVLELPDGVEGRRGRWIQLDGSDPVAPTTGGTAVGRGTGMCWHEGSIYMGFSGIDGSSAIWRLSDRALDVDVGESTADLVRWMDGPSAGEVRVLASAPWGDLMVTTSSDGATHLKSVTMQKQLHSVAREPSSFDPFGGVCFSGNGRRMFLNSMSRGHTIMVSLPDAPEAR